MRAQYITEESTFSPFQAKSEEEVWKSFRDYANTFAWNTIGDEITGFFERLASNGISYDFILNNEEQILKVFLNEIYGSASHAIEVDLEDRVRFKDEEEIDESLEDTFRPKSKEAIIKSLRDGEWDEFTLKDGRSLWLVEMNFPGMAGESVSWYSLVDENGEEHSLSNETLDSFPFTMDDRIELVRLMDDTMEDNHQAAVNAVI